MVSMVPEALSIIDISKLLNVDRKTVRLWCMNGKITAHQDPKSKKFPWRITVISFVNFLYRNPKWLNRFKTYNQDETRYKNMRNIILENLSAKPQVYSTTDLSNIFFVSTETVKSWVRYKKLIPIKTDKTTNRQRLFNEKSITDFLNKVPRYKPLYELYRRNNHD